MIIPIIQFSIAAAIIVVAGSFLARGADLIAEITGLGRLLVGSILLAGATSLPELTVDISAVRMGHSDMAVGDLFGSCLINLLILALLDLATVSKGRMLSRLAAGHALSGSMSTAIVALAGLSIFAAPYLPQTSLLGVSPSGWLLVIAYVLGVRMVFVDQQQSAAVVTDSASGPSAAHSGLGRPLGMFFAAAAVVVFTGPYLAEAAGRIAEQSGLGGTFVGTSFVAVCTSLPELVASLTAIRLGSLDLAIGNVFGSNTFNMLLLVPLDAFHAGSLFADASPAHVISCLAIVTVTTVVLMGQLYHLERRRRLIEPDAWLVLLLVSAAMVLVFRASS